MKKVVSIALAIALLAAVVALVVISGDKTKLADEKATIQATLDSVKAEYNTFKADANAKIATAEGAVADVQAQLEAATGDQTAHDAAIEALNGEKAAIEAQVADLTAAKAALDDEYAALVDKNTALAQELADQQAKAAADLEALKTEKAGIEADLAAAKAEADKLIADAVAVAKAEAEQQLNAVLAEKEEVEQKLAAAAQNAAELPVLTMAPGPVLAKELTIYHTNDVHARVTDYLGYAKLAAIVNAKRAEGAEVLLLDAGDVTHGTAYATLVEGSSIIELMNAVGYDAMTPGNHDFNYGYTRLKELEAMMNFPLVNCNVLLEDGSNAFTPYVIVEKAGKRIAIIGAANPQMVSAIHPDKIAGLVYGGVEYVEKTVAEVKDLADFVIILTHWGADDAYDPNSSILAAIPGVDLVIDGHSHTEMANIKTGNVTSAGEHMKFLGEADVTFNAEGASIGLKNLPYGDYAELAGDEAVQAIIDRVKGEQKELLAVVVGETKVDLDGERATNRTSETNLGNLATDALVAYTGADFAITNGGGIRVSVPAGNVTMGDLVNIFPFGNTVVTIEVSGKALREAFEQSVSLYPETNGGFLQASAAVKVVFDPAQPVGSRIVSITVNGVEVTDDMVFTVATNDFTAAGGDNYAMLKDCKLVKEYGTLDEAMIAYFKQVGAVEPAIEGRITVVEAAAANAA